LEGDGRRKDTSKIADRPKNLGSENALLLKQVFESLASVERAAGCWFRDGDLRGLLIGGRSGVLFDGRAELIELAIVLAVFGSDALWNRLRALKLRAGIEEAALLAAVEFGVALGAGAAGVKAGYQNRATIGAAGTGDGADHSGSARTEMIVLSARTSLRWLAFWAGLLFFIGIAIPAMTVLAIHKFLRTLAERQNEQTENSRYSGPTPIDMEKGGSTYCTLVCIQSDCYTWRRKRYFPKISGSEGTAGIQEQKMGQPCL
jgi:hypothetical protein